MIKEPKSNVKMTTFLIGAAGISASLGFLTSMFILKRKESQTLRNSVLPNLESGLSLGCRALGLGTLFAVSGTSLLYLGIWKLSGANDFEEFRQKVGRFLPQITKHNSSGRSDFENFEHFINYLNQYPQSESKISNKPVEN